MLDREKIKMKHEIEGIPEGLEIIDAHIISNMRGTNRDGSSQLFASITVRKKQPRRIYNNESYDPSSPNGFD